MPRGGKIDAMHAPDGRILPVLLVEQIQNNPHRTNMLQSLVPVTHDLSIYPHINTCIFLQGTLSNKYHCF